MAPTSAEACGGSVSAVALGFKEPEQRRRRAPTDWAAVARENSRDFRKGAGNPKRQSDYSHPHWAATARPVTGTRGSPGMSLLERQNPANARSYSLGRWHNRQSDRYRLMEEHLARLAVSASDLLGCPLYTSDAADQLLRLVPARRLFLI